MDFPAAIQAFQPDTQDYIAVLTRGHRHDADCLTALSHCPVPTYLGMIGSRRRVKELKTHLEETEHLSHEWLESIHTPIGLAIKAVTPEEIAISILAELILTKRTLRPDHIAPSDADLDVIAALADPPANRTDLKARSPSWKPGQPRRRSKYDRMRTEPVGTIKGAEAGLVQIVREVT
ncbi:MAG: XdhC family protein [Clostridium fessum]